ncbi:MAG: hypothetical protein AB1461_18255 [Thermodesulfobacteriota bacterium]
MKFLRPLLLAITLGLLFGCAGSHEFGPYKGKVVDADTGEPIEGAVVFMKFFTEGGQFIGLAGGYLEVADAVEVLTDRNGEFNIPLQKLTVNKFLHKWENKGRAIIFKPSYGAFPGHPKVSMNIPGYSIPENKFVIIKLPKLKTREERERNLRYASGHDVIRIPIEKQQIILKLYNTERKNIGLSPIPIRQGFLPRPGRSK